MTLNYLVEQIKKIALLQPNVNTATEGDVYDVLNGNPSVKYGVIHLTQTTHRTQEDQDIYGFNIFYIDRLLGDNSNKLQIQSIGKELIYNILKSLDETFDTETSSITFQPFTEKFNDLCAGVYASVNVSSFIDYDCAEQYGEYIKPTFQVINNQDITITDNGTYLPQEGYTGFGKVEVKVSVDDYYNRGFEEGKEEQKSLIQPITITENGEYTNENGYSPINVNIDTDSYYNNGYNEGYVQGESEGYNDGFSEGFDEGVVNGKEEQKSLLENIKITENGVYDNENGYDVVEVEVDTQSYYDEGYRQAEEDVVKDAQVLNITENGTYKTKYTPPIIPDIVTGILPDGSNFYSYAELNGIIFDTGIKVSENTKIEMWYKPYSFGNDKTIIGSQVSNNNAIFKIRTMNDGFYFEVAMTDAKYYTSELKWYHFEMSFEDGLYVDGEFIGKPTKNVSGEMYNIYINAFNLTASNRANGTFGMIKIDDVVIIPTEEGFKNLNTNELLTVVQSGGYVFYDNNEVYFDGNLIKEVNVNVNPKVYVRDGLKFGYSNITYIPDYLDFEGVYDFSNMFYNCNRLTTIRQLDTSKATNMSYMFYICGALTSIPQLDTSNVTNMNDMFYNCINLTTIPQLDTSNVTIMNEMFYKYDASDCKLQSLPPLECGKVTNIGRYFGHQSYPRTALTDVGGWINLKCKWDDGYGLNTCPNLTYESCINILNGLYDFTGNGETPNSNQGKLKVSQSFMDLVGNEISIGINKGWTITV